MEGMHRVERGQLWVMRLQALGNALFLLAASLVAEGLLAPRLGLPRGFIAGTLFVLLLYPTLVAPGRRYRALGYRMSEDELHVARGVWTQMQTVVPLGRVQHIDVSQGPLERAFGVSRLVLHTAGTMNSLVVLPGLARETAERMRDEIRGRIRQELA